MSINKINHTFLAEIDTRIKSRKRLMSQITKFLNVSGINCHELNRS